MSISESRRARPTETGGDVSGGKRMDEKESVETLLVLEEQKVLDARGEEEKREDYLLL